MNTYPGLRWNDGTAAGVSEKRRRPTVCSRFDENNVVDAFKLDPERPNAASVPRYYPALPGEHIIADTRDDGEPISTDARFVGTLRPSQRAVVDAFRNRSHGVVVLGCGMGKTATAIYLATEVFRRRTLYVVHRDTLFEQVCSEIAQFAPAARVGTIRQSRVDVDGDKDIVVAMLQSLCMHDYPKEVYRGFGVVVVDEAHHICSNVFSRLLPKLAAAVRIGLSATPERADGMTPLLRWHIGENVIDTVSTVPAVSVSSSHTTRLAVMFRLNYEGTRLGDEPERAAPKSHAGKMAQRSVLLKRMTACAPREQFVAKKLRTLYDDRSGARNVVAFTHQVDHMHRLYRSLCRTRPAAARDAVTYYGKLKKQARADAKERGRVLVATYQMASEGFDLPRLDTLFLATPARSDVTQILGRIEREYPNKAPLLVFDLWDDIGPFARSGWVRRRTYKARGFTVIIENVRLADIIHTGIAYTMKQESFVIQ